MIAAVFALAATSCQPPAVHAIQQGQDTREVWVYVDATVVGRTGLYRCYDNAGRPQCVKAELTRKLAPSPGFCANHGP